MIPSILDASPLLAEIRLLRLLRIQLPDSIANWLTPIWILGVGAIVGLILFLVIVGLGRLLSKLPVLGNLDRNPVPLWISIAALTVLIGGGLAAMGGIGGGAAAEGAAVWSVIGTIAVALFISMGLVSVCSERAQRELGDSIREGVLLPMAWTVVGLAVFGVFGLTIVREPDTMLENLSRYVSLASGGEVTQTYDIPAPASDTADPEQVELPVNFRSAEIQRISIEGDQRVKVSTSPFDNPTTTTRIFDVVPDEKPTEKTSLWVRTPESVLPFRETVVTNLYAKNYGTQPAKLTATFTSQIASPEMLLVPRFGLLILFVFMAYTIQRTLFPKLAAVAHATAKSDVASPTYAILMGLGVFALAVFVFIPYNTFGEDIKMLKDSGLTLILVFGIIQAVWAASQSVSQEIEGKTALTVLSKPVGRKDFILGKFFGIGWSAGMMIAILGLVLLVCVAYKPIYDAREGSIENPTWQLCTREMLQVVPGLFLAFLEVLVIAAISVAISTRLPMVPNFILCFTIYVLGHLTPLLVQSKTVAENAEAVIFLGKMLATVLPVLDHFNIQASISAGVAVPTHYLIVTTAYCALYSTIAMLLALVLFEDRDLA
ncbi:MAG: ABC transporter permease [Planctomycetaceae bacterium]